LLKIREQWLEKRFLLHLWDDKEAAEREEQRVQSTHHRLALVEETDKLNEQDLTERACASWKTSY